jgi:hypothetical protein
MSTLQQSRLPEKRDGNALGSMRCREHRAQLDANWARMNAGVFGQGDAIRLGGVDSRRFVYLLALTDGTAFNVGSCSHPLRCLHSFASRFHERFDLSASVLVEMHNYDEACALETRLKHTFAHGRTDCPPWFTRTVGAQPEWFRPAHFADAQQHLAAAPVRVPSGVHRATQIIAADLIKHRQTIEDWVFSAAKHLNAEVAYSPGARQLQLAQSLRDWLDIFRHFHVPLFAKQSEQGGFVCQIVRLYGSALMTRL